MLKCHDMLLFVLLSRLHVAAEHEDVAETKCPLALHRARVQMTMGLGQLRQPRLWPSTGVQSAPASLKT
jgi:hypothetical protein